MLGREGVVACVATADADRARGFYEAVLGLTLREDSPFALVFDANGVMLRIQKVPSVAPAPYTALGWNVADIRQTMTGLMRRGVAFERYAGLVQDELGIWVSPGGAQEGWFRDPDGNLLSLTQ